MYRSPWLSLALCLFVYLPGVGAAPPAERSEADEKLLKSAGQTTDGPGLLAFFRKRLPGKDDRNRAEELVEKLAGKQFRVREKATEELKRLGLPARPALVQALKHRDAEVRRRAEECLAIIDRANSPAVEAAAVRLLKAQRPDGACAVLLDFLPSVRDELVEEETLSALVALGVRDGKPDKALAIALESKDPVQRGAAALVLAHAGPDALRAKVRALLGTETDARVKLRIAQGLFSRRDRQSIPVLLALLKEAPAETARQALDLLSWAGGDTGPSEALGEDAAARMKCSAAWEVWWKTHEAKLDLVKAEADLPWRGTGQRARAVTLDFINALLKGNAELLKRSTDVPFTFMGVITMNTRQELDQMLGQAMQLGQQQQRPKVELSPPRLGNLEKFLQTMPQQMKDFVGKFPRGELRLVYLTGKQVGMDREETAAILVRLRGGRARVIGLAEASSKARAR